MNLMGNFFKSLQIVVIFIIAIPAMDRSIHIPKSLISFNEKKNEILIGKKDAPNQMIIYSGLSCEHCAEFYVEVFPMVLSKYVLPGNLLVRLRDIPVDRISLTLIKVIYKAPKSKMMLARHRVFTNMKDWRDDDDYVNRLKNILKGIVPVSEIGVEDKDIEISETMSQAFRKHIKKDNLHRGIPLIIFKKRENGWEKSCQGSLSFEETSKILQDMA